MSADNYALVGINPLAGTGLVPTTLHGVYVGFMSNDHRPSEIPLSSKTFPTHEKAAAYAEELETEYGVSFLCNCTTEDKQAPAAKRTVRQVVTDYADILDHIYRTRTAGVFTWKGILYDFLGEIASTED